MLTLYRMLWYNASQDIDNGRVFQRFRDKSFSRVKALACLPNVPAGLWELVERTVLAKNLLHMRQRSRSLAWLRPYITQVMRCAVKHFQVVVTLSHIWRGDTEINTFQYVLKGRTTMYRSILLWLLLLSAMATWIVNALMPSMALRPLIVLWFLLVCPG